MSIVFLIDENWEKYLSCLMFMKTFHCTRLDETELFVVIGVEFDERFVSYTHFHVKQRVLRTAVKTIQWPQILCPTRRQTVPKLDCIRRMILEKSVRLEQRVRLLISENRYICLLDM